MDYVFLLTLLFIFLTAIISAYIARSNRDRCLKDFDDFHVTIELKDGRIIWGKLAVFSNGLETLYKLPHRDTRGHLETSAIFLQAQLSNIQAIYRYHDELSDANKEKRQLEILRTYHPGLHRQLARAMRSFLNTFRDALNESIGFVISSVKGKGTSTIIDTQDQRLTKIGKTVVEASTANAYEPILERYIGRRVVTEELRGEDASVEHPGILKEYTAEWVELLDCPLAQEHLFDLSQPERLQLNRDLDFIIQNHGTDSPKLIVKVENHGDDTLYVKRFEAENYSQSVEAELLPGETVSINLFNLPSELFAELDLSQMRSEVAWRAEQRATNPEVLPTEIPPLPSLRLVIEATREGDVCLPRPHTFIRHGVEPPGQSWLKESWYRDFRPWIQEYRWRSFWRISWILFNIIISGFVGWAVIVGWGIGNKSLALIAGLIIGLVYGSSWLIQWSMIIQSEYDHGRRLKRHLTLVTAIMIVLIGWLMWVYLLSI